jgi:RNA polymerase sigma factor (sigma-70 family)
MSSGEVAAEDPLAQLYELEYRPMLALAYLLVGSRAAAEDIVQDAFTAMSGRLPGIDNPAAYVRTSIVNGSRRWHRRLAREQRWAAEVPTAVADRSGDVVAVRGALADLPPEQREAIVLRFFADLSFREIGEATGCPTQTAATRVRRGLDRIKGALEDER